VEWLEGEKVGSRSKPRVDYREILSPEEFTLFSRLRDKRKELAQRDGVQVYTIMTNEQLAEVVKQNIVEPSELTRIERVGAARIEKYGYDLLSVLAAPR